MESPLAVYQLIILYLLTRGGGEIAMPHISNFLIENGYVNFESLVGAYEEAENNGFVSSRTLPGDKTFLSVTDEGRQTLKFFESQLSPAIQQQADAYLRSIGRELVDDRSIISEYYKASYGGYIAHMVVKEDKAILLEVNLNVPTEDAAKQVLRNWREKSGDVYQSLIQQLF
ncbi:protein of unknown function [Lachnospiraceae bacterium NK3A20]|nr:protein of unknown function [Lachnospiraceae bacterium NK3A20]